MSAKPDAVRARTDIATVNWIGESIARARLQVEIFVVVFSHLGLYHDEYIL